MPVNRNVRNEPISRPQSRKNSMDFVINGIYYIAIVFHKLPGTAILNNELCIINDR